MGQVVFSPATTLKGVFMIKRMCILGLGVVLLVVFTQSLGFSKGRSNEIGDLDQVIKNQERILSKLDEIKKELYIIKIRASG